LIDNKAELIIGYPTKELGLCSIEWSIERLRGDGRKRSQIV
jgi:hypothetical protein